MAESFDIMGRLLGQTVSVATSDTSVLFTTALETALGLTPNWAAMKAVTITCEDNDARIAFGTAAVQGASAVGHVLAENTSMRIPSSSMIREARIISKTAGSAAVLQCTVEQ